MLYPPPKTQYADNQLIMVVLDNNLCDNHNYLNSNWLQGELLDAFMVFFMIRLVYSVILQCDKSKKHNYEAS